MSELGRTISIRVRIAGGLLLLAGGLGAVALIGVRALDAVRASAEEELQAMRIAEISNALVIAVSNEIQAAERYLDRRSEASLVAFREEGTTAYRHRSRLRDIGGLSEEDRVLANRIVDLQARMEVWYALAHAQAELGRREEALETAAAAQEPGDRLLASVRSFAQRQRSRAVDHARTVRRTAEERRLVVWVILLGTLVVAGAIGVTTVRSVTRPLRRFRMAAERLAGGDLRPIQLGGIPGELGILAAALEEIAGRLREIIGRIQGESDRVAGASENLSAMSEELAATAGQVSSAMVEIVSGAEEQVRELEESERTMEALAVELEESREAGERVDVVGGEIHETAESSRKEVAAATDALLELSGFVEESAVRVEELHELSAAMGRHVELIKDVARRTHLLAMNASIEAAQGGGGEAESFAVIAEEVRELAESSAGAAEEATSTLEKVRTGIGEVAEVMREGRKRMEGVEVVASAAGDSLEEIVRSVAEVRRGARELVRETEESLTSVARVREALSEVSRTAEGHAASSEEVTAAAEEQGASTEELAAQAAELQQAAAELQGLVQDFEV